MTPHCTYRFKSINYSKNRIIKNAAYSIYKMCPFLSIAEKSMRNLENQQAMP